MSTCLKNKVALITGASSGIGRATAFRFAELGARIALADIDADHGMSVLYELEKLGCEAIFVPTDVRNSSDIDRLVSRTIEAYGRLDCAFNNAGVSGEMANTLDCTEDNFDETIKTNLKGLWLCMRAELRQMTAQGSGVIVNMSSVAGTVGFPLLPAYVASKHAINGLTKTAALEFATTGIRINAVCPGVVDTNMVRRITRGQPEATSQFSSLQPMNRMGDPKEIAAVVSWLCSEDASFVTGHCLAVDGGYLAR